MPWNPPQSTARNLPWPLSLLSAKAGHDCHTLLTLHDLAGLAHYTPCLSLPSHQPGLGFRFRVACSLTLNPACLCHHTNCWSPWHPLPPQGNRSMQKSVCLVGTTCGCAKWKTAGRLRNKLQHNNNLLDCCFICPSCTFLS